MTLTIFITGGTFDKEYNQLNGELYFKDTHVPEILKLGKSKLDVNIRTLMMIDSLDMTDSDRKIVLENCLKCKDKYIVITHGTDSMVETAKELAKEIKDKTIIITGAMVPYKFGSSDGLFNMGSALSFAQTLKPGVYIAMNGKYFKHDNVMKNKKLGEFEEIK